MFQRQQAMSPTPFIIPIMSKLYRKLIYVLMSAAVATAFTACDKDDDKNKPDDPTTIDPNEPTNPSTSTPSCVYTLPTGYKVVLSKIGDTEFIYNDSGRVTGISRYGDWAIIDYSAGTITDKYDTYNFTLNANGCISSMTESWSENQGDEIESGTTTYQLSYTSDNRLSKVEATLKVNFTYPDTGVTNYITEKYSWDFTWENGSLTKEEYKAWVDDWDYPEAVEDYYSSESTCTIQNSQDNSLRQYTERLSEIFDVGEYGEELYLCGLFGAAPNRLPALVIYTSKNFDINGNQTFSYSRTSHYTYDMNADGTIAYENHLIDDYGNYYTFTTDYTYEFFGQRPPQNDDNSGNVGGGNGGGSSWDKAPQYRPASKSARKGLRARRALRRR